MAVEAAMGQPGRRHDLDHPDAVEAPFPEHPGRGIEDPPAVSCTWSRVTFIARSVQKPVDIYICRSSS